MSKKMDAYIEKWIARLEKELDRLAKKYPPEVTPAPKPDPVPAPQPDAVKSVYVARRLFKESRKEFKCSGACIEADGTLVMGVYGNDMPRNRTEILHDGKRVFPARGYYDAETLFPYAGGYVVAERGYQLKRNGNTYKPTKCKSRWAACMSFGPATIYNAAPDSKIKRMDFDTGKVVQEMEGTDVPHDAANFAGGGVGIAVENYGIVYTDGRPSVRCKPRAYHYVDFVEIVGDAGHLRAIKNGKLVQFLDGDPKLGEVVDSIAVDSAGIWFTTSNEDGLYLVPTGTRKAVQVVSFDDVEQGGSVFGCCFATNGKRRVFVRNVGGRNSWEAFEIVADDGKPTTPDPTKPTTDEAIAWSSVQWMNGDLSKYIARAELDAVIENGKLGLALRRAIGGNDLSAVSICKRDGQLYGGTFDGLGDNVAKVAFVKSLTNMGAKSNTKGGPYWAGSSAANRKRFRPIQGETMWVAIVDKSTRVRSTVAEIIWKE